ncbi:hypothetical protein C5167_047015 [Papaver somniferum]|uniref:Uncharacterized protein n=1 Tax=Papaver somniferum TaxID=3469 RepID=A0A4Y7LJ75_PAPSO|nr:uncharacterized protein LOC113322056 [Papaver somniferum]RZC84229.1 hypothetical protein C5167_047015 [Papaver somniferum]
MDSKDQSHQQKLYLGSGDAFGSAATTADQNLYSSHFIQLEELNKPVPFGFQRFLDIKTGQISYKKEEIQELEPKKMSRTDAKSENNSTLAKLDLKLNLSPPVLDQLIITTAANSSASPTSSCVTIDMNYSCSDSNMKYEPWRNYDGAV